MDTTYATGGIIGSLIGAVPALLGAYFFFKKKMLELRTQITELENKEEDRNDQARQRDIDRATAPYKQLIAERDIFNQRLEQKIDVLQARIEAYAIEHMKCQTENARLNATVENLKARVAQMEQKIPS
jgi:hypothetical protein